MIRRRWDDDRDQEQEQLRAEDDAAPVSDCDLCGDLKLVRVTSVQAHTMRPFCVKCGRRIPAREVESTDSRGGWCSGFRNNVRRGREEGSP